MYTFITREEVVRILQQRYRLTVESLHECFDKVTRQLTKAKYRPTGTRFRPPAWKQDMTEFKLKMIRARRTLGKKYDHAKWMRRLKCGNTLYQ